MLLSSSISCSRVLGSLAETAVAVAEPAMSKRIGSKLSLHLSTSLSRKWEVKWEAFISFGDAIIVVIGLVD